MPLDELKQFDKPDDTPGTIPGDRKKLLKFALDLVEKCRSSAGLRAAYCRQLYAISETGKQDGTRSLINLLWSHLDRLASHLYSPVVLRLSTSFRHTYPKNILERGKEVARLLTDDFESSNTDVLFGAGVFEALRYGACIMKQWPMEETDGDDKRVTHNSSLVMPWMFGLYREDQNNLYKQPAMVETVMLSLPEVWRRIWHLPDAEALYRRIESHARRSPSGSEDAPSFFHQVLSTTTLNTGNTGMIRPVPGGIVQLNNDPNYAIIGPEIAVDLVRMHEIWCFNGNDFGTIQIIEPDILVAPRLNSRKANLLIGGDSPSGLHPYTMIQPNMVHGYAWGRSELVDLIEPQGWLSTTATDLKRLVGLQIDKILGFTGVDDLLDEKYDQMRAAGYMSVGQGGGIQDLTPKIPPEAIPMMEMIMGIIDRLGGFDNLLSGRGEPGVRAGVHANTLLKTASPRMRDRSLLVERQLAQAADLWLHVLEAKDGTAYWTDATNQGTVEATKFHLSDLPADRMVKVDSHSSSPIFSDDHSNLIGFGIKAGFVDGESAIDLLNFPEKDMLKSRLKEKEAQQQALMKQLLERDPEALEKILTKKTGRR
jgi:hypothetical protein